jgi:hypothetical protein
MERVGVVVGLVAGVLIGYNWPTIKKTVGPIAETVSNQISTAVIGGLRYVMEMKESYEDRVSETRAEKEAAATQPNGNGASAEGTV